MPTTIKEFVDGSRLEYDQGKFDRWCVYLTRPGTTRYAPQDHQYFTDLLRFAVSVSVGREKVYADFVSLFELVRARKELCESGHELIQKITSSYPTELQLDVEITFTILFAAMVAEENKKWTKLGCKVKRLGVHQILVDDPPLAPKAAAKFSVGMKAPAIAVECEARGF